jgi:hypothetical protein
MPGRNKGYKPLNPTGENYEKTTQDNIDRIFQILNRLEYRISQIENQYNSLVISISSGDDESRAFALMMMDDE